MALMEHEPAPMLMVSPVDDAETAVFSAEVISPLQVTFLVVAASATLGSAARINESAKVLFMVRHRLACYETVRWTTSRNANTKTNLCAEPPESDRH
jgi:hypothetical protein